MTSGDDPRDPFDEIFRELERMMNQMFSGSGDMRVSTGMDTGFGSNTHVDIHEQPDELRVIADLPGVVKEDIQLKCDGRVLVISANNDQRQYDERVELPALVDEESATAKYNNGVLEVVLSRESRSSDINVE